MNLDEYKYDGDKKFKISHFDTRAKDLAPEKEVIVEASLLNMKKIEILQDKLYAQGTDALLIIIQAMDAGGKDSAIKHVLTGISPQGFPVLHTGSQ